MATAVAAVVDVPSPKALPIGQNKRSNEQCWEEEGERLHSIAKKVRTDLHEAQRALEASQLSRIEDKAARWSRFRASAERDVKNAAQLVGQLLKATVGNAASPAAAALDAVKRAVEKVEKLNELNESGTMSDLTSECRKLSRKEGDETGGSAHKVTWLRARAGLSNVLPREYTGWVKAHLRSRDALLTLDDEGFERNRTREAAAWLRAGRSLDAIRARLGAEGVTNADIAESARKTLSSLSSLEARWSGERGHEWRRWSAWLPQTRDDLAAGKYSALSTATVFRPPVCGTCFVACEGDVAVCQLCDESSCADCLRHKMFPGDAGSWSMASRKALEDVAHLRCNLRPCLGRYPETCALRLLDDKALERRQDALRNLGMSESTLQSAEETADRLAAYRAKSTVEQCLILSEVEALTDLVAVACPRCRAPVAEFTGCVTLECPCGMHFCGLCVHKAYENSTEAHRHVLACLKRPEDMQDYFLPDAAWRKLMKDRKDSLVGTYLGGRRDLPAAVYEELRRRFAPVAPPPAPAARGQVEEDASSDESDASSDESDGVSIADTEEDESETVSDDDGPGRDFAAAAAGLAAAAV
jgi:hypothetical protein